MALDQNTRYKTEWTCIGPIFISDGDNETITVAHVPFNFRIYEITFDTSGALGASLGVDVVDGGSSGTGTTVIQASSDNLNGSEIKQVDYLLDDGDYINVTVDNITAKDIAITIWGELYVPA